MIKYPFSSVDAAWGESTRKTVAKDNLSPFSLVTNPRMENWPLRLNNVKIKDKVKIKYLIIKI